MGRRYTDEFLEQAYNYMIETDKGVTAVARHFGVDGGTLSARLKKKYGEENVISRKDGKLEVDSDFFENINTEEKAYWLGFLTADGCLTKNGYLKLALGKKDLEHLKKFKHDIKSKHKIRENAMQTIGDKKYCVPNLSIKDKKIEQDLKNLGFNNNKSYEAYIPFSKIPNDLMNHYIRGLFDGDGSIYTTKNNKTSVVICTTSSCQMIDDITQYIKSELNLEVKYCVNTTYTDIKLNKKNDIYAFQEWLYKDATVYLERKYDKFAVLRQDCKKS